MIEITVIIVALVLVLPVVGLLMRVAGTANMDSQRWDYYCEGKR